MGAGAGGRPHRRRCVRPAGRSAADVVTGLLGKVGLSPDALLGRVLAFPAGGLANSVLQVVDALAPSGDPKAPPRTAGDRFLAALTLVTDIDPLGLFGERSVLDAATSEIQRRLLDGAVSKLAGLAEPGYARSRRESP